MKILLSCPVCHINDGYPGRLFMDYLKSEDIGEYTCEKGHKFYAILSNQRYQTIFDYAIKSLKEGVLPVAVLLSYMSLETFMEFFIRFSLFLDKCKFEDIDSFMKTIRFAENKKGSFMLHYFQNFNEEVSKKKFEYFAKLRNKIIHEGYLPDEDETIKYCEKLFNFLVDISNRIAKSATQNQYINYDLNYQMFLTEKLGVDTNVARASIFIPPMIPSFFECKNCKFKERMKTFEITKTYSYENPFDK